MLFCDLQIIETNIVLFEVFFILALKKENHLMPKYEIILFFFVLYIIPDSLIFCTA